MCLRYLGIDDDDTPAGADRGVCAIHTTLSSICADVAAPVRASVDQVLDEPDQPYRELPFWPA